MNPKKAPGYDLITKRELTEKDTKFITILFINYNYIEVWKTHRRSKIVSTNWPFTCPSMVFEKLFTHITKRERNPRLSISVQTAAFYNRTSIKNSGSN